MLLMKDDADSGSVFLWPQTRLGKIIGVEKGVSRLLQGDQQRSNVHNASLWSCNQDKPALHWFQLYARGSIFIPTNTIFLAYQPLFINLLGLASCLFPSEAC